MRSSNKLLVAEAWTERRKDKETGGSFFRCSMLYMLLFNCKGINKRIGYKLGAS